MVSVIYGEAFTTGELAESIAMIAERINTSRIYGYQTDDGTIEDARNLMEGSLVLWERLMEERWA